MLLCQLDKLDICCFSQVQLIKCEVGVGDLLIKVMIRVQSFLLLGDLTKQ